MAFSKIISKTLIVELEFLCSPGRMEKTRRTGDRMEGGVNKQNLVSLPSNEKTQGST